MCSEYRYSPVESEVFQVIIWENDEGMTVLDYSGVYLLVGLVKVRRKLVEGITPLLASHAREKWIILASCEVLEHVYGI